MSVIILVSIAALQAAPPPADLSWMAGYWLSCEDGREVSETWSDPRGGVMAGTTLTVGRSGRGAVEFARIMPRQDGRLAFLAQPNGTAPTAFALVGTGPMQAEFENPDHDFPQRVLYRREGEALVGRIEGQQDGQAVAVEWRYRAAPLNARCPGG